jgi:hypothetical protein
LELLDRRRPNRIHFLAKFPVEDFAKVIGQYGQIIPDFSESRHRVYCYTHAVVQIGPKQPVLYELLEVLIGGGDYAQTDVHFFGAANSTKPSGFEEVEQLPL